MIQKTKKNKRLSQVRSTSSMFGQRKGFLLAEETLKIVIALIAISFLIYFLTSLYFAKINEIEYEKAKATLTDSDESLKATLENLNDGETREYLINDPGEWHLVSFSGNIKPNLCSGNSCLCICKDSGNKIESQAKQCDGRNNGVCTPANIEKDIKIKIRTEITKISIQKTNQEISINEIGTATEIKTASVSNEKGEYVSVETGKIEDEGIFAVALNGIKNAWCIVTGFFCESDASQSTNVIGVKG